ncbi:alpha/beta-hydrolase family protein [Janibacter limosus]|uniref:alpha/beta-hydrolase family protein n=1 Tax=Janibacter limosus TaxID=53458 RepID=UPI0035D8FFDB|nr:alpha/beta-hydrolase family protein [Janibacter limosus]
MTTALTRTALVTLPAALVWAALVVAGRPPAVVPDPGSSAAVAALTSRSAETAAGTVPTDFVADLGYVPRLEGQRLVNPTGSCSSPVPLPAEFEGPCRQHDTGYDLLRHAAHKGGALPTAARQHLDAQLVDSARASCAVRQGISRGWCSAWADIAGFFVRVNSVRQHDSAPLPEDALSRAAMGAGALTLVGGTGTLALGGVRLRRSGAAQRVRRRLATLPVPRVSGAAAAVTGLALSISPSHLAHGPVLQGGLTAVCVGASVLVGHALRPHVPLLLGRARVWALTGVAAGAVGTLAWGQPALSARRPAIGMPPTDVTGWATVAAVVGAAWLVVRSLRWGWSRRRTARRPTVVVSIASTVVFSGGPVHGAVTAPEDRVLLQSSPVGAVRAYAEMREGEVAGERAERAADELELARGLAREHVVIAVPTGSGWVNPRVVAGLEERFGAQVATVAMQYDDAPSWVSYLLRRDEAVGATGELVDAVTDRVGQLPANRRPRVHVYGESPGATAGQAVFGGAGTRRAGEVCSVLWTGTPGGHRAGLPREVAVANLDDPVVHASPRDLLLPPGDGRPWVPVVSALHDAADLVGSLDVPDGSGHRYGPATADRLETCP